jgi:alpha-L-fucosidase 2
MKPTILIAVITLASCAALRASEPPKGEPTNAVDCAGVLLAVDGTAARSDGDRPAVGEIVRRHTAIRTDPTGQTPHIHLPDGNLLGNGDIGVVVAGGPDRQTFYIGKNDFWVPCTRFGYLRGTGIGQQNYPIGGVSVTIPALAGARFFQEMDLHQAESRSVFAKENLSVRYNAKVVATENVLIVELENSGSAPVTVEVETWTRSNSVRYGPNKPTPADLTIPDTSTAGTEGDLMWVTRDSTTLPDDAWRTHAAIVTRVLGTASTSVARDRHKVGCGLTLAAGQQAIIVAQVGNAVQFAPSFQLSKIKELVVEGEESLSQTRKRCAGWTIGAVRELERRHQEWWEQYWGKSWVELPGEPLLEKFFYGAVYLMGAGARAGKVAPGLYGPWTTSDTAEWSADYHLDYNFQHSWYGVYAINRPELALAYCDAIVNLLPLARETARKNKQEGLLFLTCAGPYGWAYPSHNSLPNNAESAINFRDYYQFTQDLDFLRNVAYPFMKEVALNWDAKLIKEPGVSGQTDDYRYKVHMAWDERAIKVDNPTSCLAFVRALYEALVQASEKLGADSELLPRWRDIVEHLSTWPTTLYKGKTVFDFGEGRNEPEGSVYPYNTYPFYPAAVEGLDSPCRQTLINTLATRPSYWTQENAFTQVFAAAAQGGYPTEELIERLRTRLRAEMAPNGVRVPGHSTLENAFAVNNVVLMLLQSDDGCVRVFPVWDLKKDARFLHLRARGAFLVSSEIKNGAVQYVRINSEKGGPITVVNPWAGFDLVVSESRGGQIAAERQGIRYTFATTPGETYDLAPAASARPQSGSASSRKP